MEPIAVGIPRPPYLGLPWRVSIDPATCRHGQCPGQECSYEGLPPVCPTVRLVMRTALPPQWFPIRVRVWSWEVAEHRFWKKVCPAEAGSNPKPHWAVDCPHWWIPKSSLKRSLCHDDQLLYSDVTYLYRTERLIYTILWFCLNKYTLRQPLKISPPPPLQQAGMVLQPWWFLGRRRARGQ